MLSAFKASAKKLQDAGYTARPYGNLASADILTKDSTIVFGDENIILLYDRGGSFSDNGGRHYVTAEIQLIPRNWEIDGPVRYALEIVKADHPELFARLGRSVPRSVARELDVLSVVEDIATQVRRVMPLAQQKAHAKLDLRARERAAFELGQQRRALTPEIEHELLRLLDEGLLEGSNGLSGLRYLAVQLKENERDMDALRCPVTPQEPSPARVSAAFPLNKIA